MIGSFIRSFSLGRLSVVWGVRAQTRLRPDLRGDLWSVRRERDRCYAMAEFMEDDEDVRGWRSEGHRHEATIINSPCRSHHDVLTKLQLQAELCKANDDDAGQLIASQVERFVRDQSYTKA